MAAKFVNLLPSALRPYAKAIYPFAANILYAAVALAVTGDYNAEDLRVNVFGLIGVLVTFAVPNRPKP